jgi:HEAT repeat protein
VRAIYALERIASPQVFPPLLAAVKSSDPDLRSAAVQVLGQKKDPRALGSLVPLLKDPAPAVRVHVAEALGRFADRRLVPYLAAVLKSQDAELVVEAVRSLAAIGAGEAWEKLAPLLRDPRPAVRRAVAEAAAELEL